MPYILPDIVSLAQYISHKTNNKINCIYCNRANPWRHGSYARQPDRINSSVKSMNPVYIQRCYCPGCHKTFSLLPECIPPRRWYLWETQQTAIFLFLLGYSAKSTSTKLTTSRHTIKRWVLWISSQFKLHKDILCNYFPDFGLYTDHITFWKNIFNKLSLSQAMRLCHVSGVSAP